MDVPTFKTDLKRRSPSETLSVSICLPFEVAAQVIPQCDREKLLEISATFVKLARDLVDSCQENLTVTSANEKIAIISIDGQPAALSALVDDLESAVQSRYGMNAEIDYKGTDDHGDFAVSCNNKRSKPHFSCG